MTSLECAHGTSRGLGTSLRAPFTIVALCPGGGSRPGLVRLPTGANGVLTAGPGNDGGAAGQMRVSASMPIRYQHRGRSFSMYNSASAMLSIVGEMGSISVA